MTTIKKIFNKLHNADKPKINLSLANDLSIAADVLETEEGRLQFFESLLDEAKNDLEKAEQNFEEVQEDSLTQKDDTVREISEANKILEKAEKLANELGVNPDDIPDYSMLKDRIILTEKTVIMIQDLLRQ